MKAHWKYFKYVLRHKWHVFRAGMELRVSPWQLIIHDWQKFTPAEWGPYVQSFYGPWEYKERPHWLVEAFDRAWLHHQHYGAHHWQHWILREDSGKEKVLDIPDKYIAEMIADWVGAGIAITGKLCVIDWYNRNYEKIELSPRTRAHVQAILTRYETKEGRKVRWYRNNDPVISATISAVNTDE